MKGVYTKTAIQSVVEPLKAMSSVFNNEVHVVYENEDDAMYIGVMNSTKSIRAMFKLNVAGLIDQYGASVAEVGIWDVKQFINVFGKYQNDIYSEDVTVESGDRKLVIKCGKERTDYYTSSLNLFDSIRLKVRKFKTDKLTEACSFRLQGVTLKKILTNISVFSQQDKISFSGEKGKNEVMVELSCTGGGAFNKNTFVLEDVEVKETFKFVYPKSDIKGLLTCNDYFDLNIFVGAKEMMQASYSKNNYDMNFYFSPTLVD